MSSQDDNTIPTLPLEEDIDAIKFSSNSSNSSISSISSKNTTPTNHKPTRHTSSFTGNPALDQAIAGFGAGAVSTIVLHPLDLIKTRFQGKKKNFISHFFKMPFVSASQLQFFKKKSSNFDYYYYYYYYYYYFLFEMLNSRRWAIYKTPPRTGLWCHYQNFFSYIKERKWFTWII